MVEEKKVALVGMASTSRHLAPFGDRSYEIWGLNELHCKHLPGPWDRWFEVHSRQRIENSPRTPDHLSWLQTCGIPVYMQQHWPDIPTSRPYPLELMSGLYGRYFTSTPAMMLALAIAEGFTHIELYGIDMALVEEYFQQRPCMEYLIGFARGKNITVLIADKSELLRADYLEGYEEAKNIVQPVELIEDLKGLQKYHDQLIAEIQKVQGRAQVLAESITLALK